MFGKVDFCLVGEDDSVRALLEGGFELRGDVSTQPGVRTKSVLESRHTKGMISAGSLTRRCAISSLNLIRSPMLTSQ